MNGIAVADSRSRGAARRSSVTPALRDRAGMLAPWRQALMILGGLLLLILALYYQSFASIVKIWWRSETFAHGFLIVPISAYLIWQQRHAVARLAPRPSLWGTAAFAVLVLLWGVSRLAGIQVLEQFAVVAMIPVLVWAVSGGAVTRALAFPLAYLIFAVPMGEFLVPHLQDVTADIVVNALRFTNVPVLREGRFITIPSGSFEVAEACSGIRYLIASLALGSLYAYFTYRSLGRRLLFVALSLVVPVVANGLRAYGIIMLADLSDYRLAMGVDHIIYGWLFFGVVIALLFWLGGLFKEAPAATPAVAVGEGPAAAGGRASRWYASAASLALLAVAGPLLFSYTKASAVTGYALHLPPAAGQWQGPFPVATPDWQPNFHGAVAQRLVEYRRGDDRVQLYLALYTAQDQDAELINAMNSFYRPRYWRRVAEGALSTTAAAGGALQIRTLTLSALRRERTLWYWYEVGGVPTSNDFSAKLRYVAERLRGRDGVSLAVILAHEHEAPEPGADPVLRAFLAAWPPPFSSRVIVRAADD